MTDPQDTLTASDAGGVQGKSADRVLALTEQSRSSTIAEHVSRFFGPVQVLQHEAGSSKDSIDLLHVHPTRDWPYHRLVTAGMSTVAMEVPEQTDASPFLELMITLPENWHIAASPDDDERWYWPIRQLRFLASFPLCQATWLGYGHTIPNGDPPLPFTDSINFSGVILLPSVTVDSRFHKLQLDEERTIQFLSVVPLYTEEMNLKLNQGSDALTKRFDKREVTDIVDPDRVNVARKRFVFF